MRHPRRHRYTSHSVANYTHQLDNLDPFFGILKEDITVTDSLTDSLSAATAGDEFRLCRTLRGWCQWGRLTSKMDA